MRKTIFLLATLCAVAGQAHADQAHDEVVTFVKSAITAIHKNEQAAFARFNNKNDHQFHHDGLYIFVYDTKGKCLAHGANPRLIGVDLSQQADASGRKFIQDRLKLARTAGHGWQTYQYFDPKTKAIEDKESYIERSGNLIVGAGLYKK